MFQSLLKKNIKRAVNMAKTSTQRTEKKQSKLIKKKVLCPLVNNE